MIKLKNLKTNIEINEKNYYKEYYKAKYKKETEEMRKFFFGLVLALFVFNCIFMVVIKNNAKKAQQPPAIIEEVVDTASISTEEIIVEQTPEIIVEQSNINSYPKTTSSNNIDTLPNFTTLNNFVFDDSIPLNIDMQSWITAICDYYGIDKYIVYAIIERESYYGTNVISSDGHDFGIMQIRDINHDWLNKDFGIKLDFNNNEDNTAAGIYMLNKLIIKYGEFGIHRVLMSYNMGESGAEKAWENGIKNTTYSTDVVNIYNNIKGE